MLNRRSFIALAAVATLSACAAPGQLVDANVASSLRITEVAVNTTVTRQETAVPKAEILETTRAKLETTLASVNPAGSRAVRLEVTVSQFHIANPVAGVLLGNTASSIITDMRLVDVSTGAVVKDSFRVFGNTEARPTILGSVAIKPARQELAIITNDLAANTRVAIFGN